MSPRRTRRGTIKESSVMDVSIDTSTKSTKSVRSTRRTRRNANPKGLDEENNSHMEVSNLTERDIVTSFADDSILNTKRHRRKVQDSVLNQDISLSLTVDESKSKKSNLKTPKAKTQTKSNKSKKSKKIQEDSLISEDESFNTKNEKDRKRVSYVMDNLISEDEETASNRKLVKACSRKSKTPDNPSISKKASIVNTGDGNVTPKSSPINVSFTLHRSTKTPKKSPINLGSPKTLPRSSLKLLNVPRRLSVTISPPSSENSQESPSAVNISVENTKINKKAKSTKGKSNSPTLKIKSRFSKSPKIALKSPVSKFKKSPVISQELTSKESGKNQAMSVKSPVKAIKSPATSTKSPAKSLKSPDSSRKTPVKSIKSPTKLLKAFEKSPMKSNESEKRLTRKSSLQTEVDPKVLSPAKIKLSKPKSPNKLARNLISDSPHKLLKSTEKLSKSYKVVSSLESRKSFLDTSLKSRKSLLSMPLKSKKSPLLNLSAKKMPKIVLNLKSKKSPFKLNKSTSLTKVKKSPLKATKTSTPEKMNKSLKTLTPANKSNTFLNVNKSVSPYSSFSPRVLINKLTPHNSTSDIKSCTLSIPGKQPSIKLIPVDLDDQSSIKSSKSSRSPKSLVKRSTTKYSTPAKPLRSLISTIENISEVNTPSHLLDRKLLNLKPAKTSTPRDKNLKRTLVSASNEKITLTKQSNSVVFNGLSNTKSKVIKRLNNSLNATSNPSLEDESEPSLNGSSLINMSDVFDSDNSKNNSTFSVDKIDLSTSGKNRKSKGKLTHDVLNDTYELEHPKTPALQKRINKRTSDEAELGITEEREAKKTCKVTFADLNLRTEAGPSGRCRIGTPGHVIQKQKREVSSVSRTKTPVKKIEVTKRLSSVMKSQPISTISTPMNRRQSQIASVNRLSRPKRITDSEKKVVKTPAVKKIPNFAEIHQKNFTKMESLVDLKKRVEKRHEILKIAPSSTKKVEGSKPAPPDSTNGLYSRFGFKLRKNDAVNIISKKQAGEVDSREKKRENARNTLKGVRMNRRFELQMKSRIKNS